MSDKPPLHILYVNDINHTSGLRGTATFQCPFTKDCANNRCFWKQRDCYGRCPWATALLDPEYAKLAQEITDKYGEPYFPEWVIQTGTNCLMMYCKDTKVDNEYPNQPKMCFDEWAAQKMKNYYGI